MERRETPVLMVGAGPAGLTAAISAGPPGEYRRCWWSGDLTCRACRGRRSSAPDRWRSSARGGWRRASWPAASMSSGSYGCARRWPRPSAGSAYAVGYPTREQSAVISPTAPACVPQDHLEPVLLEHLRTWPTADGRTRGGGGRPRRWARRRTGDAARRDDGRDQVRGGGICCRGRRCVQCGAAIGRHTRCMGTIDSRRPRPRCSGRRYGICWVTIGTASTVSTTPKARAPSCRPGDGDRWLFAFDFDPDVDPPSDITPERFAREIRLGAGVADLDPRIERIGTFTFAAQLAERFRAGRVFLVGDAAHRVTPRGGTGMNTAIADGFDLGWKLAWVLNAWAGRRAARLVRGGAPAGRGAQRGPVGRSARFPAARRRGVGRRPRRTHPARVATDVPHVDAGSARLGAHRLHRPKVGADR